MRLPKRTNKIKEAIEELKNSMDINPDRIGEDDIYWQMDEILSDLNDIDERLYEFFDRNPEEEKEKALKRFAQDAIIEILDLCEEYGESFSINHPFRYGNQYHIHFQYNHESGDIEVLKVESVNPEENEQLRKILNNELERNI